MSGSHFLLVHRLYRKKENLTNRTDVLIINKTERMFWNRTVCGTWIENLGIYIFFITEGLGGNIAYEDSGSDVDI